MTKECLMHSVAIHDPSGMLVEVLYHKNPMFKLGCTSKGYKFRMLNGTILDTGLYDFTLHKDSDTLGTGNLHYNAILKPSSTDVSCQGSQAFTLNNECSDLPYTVCENYYVLSKDGNYQCKVDDFDPIGRHCISGAMCLPPF